MGEISRGTDIHRVMREAVEEGSKRLPSYQRISDYAISREPLEFTRLGKLRRHVLEERYERARRGVDSQDRTSVGPVARCRGNPSIARRYRRQGRLESPGQALSRQEACT